MCTRHETARTTKLAGTALTEGSATTQPFWNRAPSWVALVAVAVATCLLALPAAAQSQPTITTLAGGPTGGAGWWDGTGAAARFYQPLGVAADGSGNLFVADCNNHTIRRIVVATGAVTTLAGTAGSCRFR